MIGFLMLLALAGWCWFGYGPRFLRWPVLVLLVLVTSRHALGESLAHSLDALAGSVLPILIVAIGIWVMTRGFLTESHRSQRYRRWRDGSTGRRWWDDRW
jgi:hypothetical protein